MVAREQDALLPARLSIRSEKKCCEDVPGCVAQLPTASPAGQSTRGLRGNLTEGREGLARREGLGSSTGDQLHHKPVLSIPGEDELPGRTTFFCYQLQIKIRHGFVDRKCSLEALRRIYFSSFKFSNTTGWRGIPARSESAWHKEYVLLR